MTEPTKNGRPKIVSLANQKGGVGKTTTAYNLARAAQQRGLKVLAVDMDPQGNLTSSLAREDFDPEAAGVADALTTQVSTTFAEVLVPSIWEGVDLAPTKNRSLDHLRNELQAANMGRETRLRKALETVGDRYDLVLIDSPPAIDQLTVNSLVAADAVLVITHADLFSMDGIGQLVEQVAGVREFFQPNLTIAGIVINLFERHLNESRSRKLEMLEGAENLNIRVYEPPVPKRAVIKEAITKAEALDAYGSAEVKSLAEIYDRYIANLLEES